MGLARNIKTEKTSISYANTKLLIISTWNGIFCDGIGGAFKRNAMRTSLQRPFRKQITTPKELFDWAITSYSDIESRFCTETPYEAVENEFKKNL